MILVLCNTFTIVFDIILIGLSSFLVPQIYKNALEGQKYAFDNYVITVIVFSKVIFLEYFFGWGNNFLSIRPSIFTGLLLQVYIVIQYIIVLLQSTPLGPRFFIPKLLLPVPFNYFKSSEDEMFVEENSECIICMNLLYIKGRNYTESLQETMHTPCGHMFHKECLINWMGIKMDCPTCRSALPVVDM